MSSMYVAQQQQTQQSPHHAMPPALPLNRNPSSSTSTALMQAPPPVNHEPQSKSVHKDGRIYSLEVKQQPIRARMCGFGDKDRRPITPPPCVRLVIKDAQTGKEVDIKCVILEVEAMEIDGEVDTTFYVLSVDLWSADGTKEVNLVHHSATSPSISAATSLSFPPPAAPAPPPVPQQQYMPMSHGGYPPQNGQLIHPSNPYSQQPYGQPSPNPQQYSQPPPPSHYGNPGVQGGYQHPNSRPPQYPPPPHGAPPPQHSAPQQNTSSNGMFTRNLIGSLSASAFKLTDPDNKIGVWFILQDLSVRTEGSFRLKMNFVNVGDGSMGVNTKASPILASTFSDVFQVFSAKKFPGVIESTPLSKCFAVQGIKIPIRRDRADDNGL